MALPPVSSLRFVLQNREDEFIFRLEDFVYFLEDLNRLYEFTRLIFDRKYEGYKFSRASMTRVDWGLSADDRLHVYRITQESPVTLILTIGAVPSAATTIFVLIQIIEKIYNFRVDHEIRMLQRDKLKKELTTSNIPPPFPDERTIKKQISSRRATRYMRDVEEKIAANPIRVVEFEVETYYDELPPHHREGQTQ